MNFLQKSFLQTNIVQLVRKKLVGYQYDGRNSPEGVLEQLVNCFLEALEGNLVFRLKHVISSKATVWSDLKSRIKKGWHKILNSRVCWNSPSTAS